MADDIHFSWMQSNACQEKQLNQQLLLKKEILELYR